MNYLNSMIYLVSLKIMTTDAHSSTNYPNHQLPIKNSIIFKYPPSTLITKSHTEKIVPVSQYNKIKPET